MRGPLAVALAAASVVAACFGAGAPLTTAAPQPLSVAELKYVVFDHVGRPWYCDPDFYPVQREDEAVLAQQRFAEVQADAETYRAILRHNGIPLGRPLTDRERLAVYRDWKQLNALALEASGSEYRFTISVEPKEPSAAQGELVSGTIDDRGVLRVSQRSAADPPMCPICLAESTLIDTPAGPVPVTDLRAGMPVWTLNVDGERVAAPLLRVASVEAPAGHEVLRVALADGRAVTASPGHPIAGGRALGWLRVGERLDGATIVAIERLPYFGRTYDLLPGGATGMYWADGVLLRSTLAR